jgi:hypothetical protein
MSPARLRRLLGWGLGNCLSEDVILMFALLRQSELITSIDRTVLSGHEPMAQLELLSGWITGLRRTWQLQVIRQNRRGMIFRVGVKVKTN